MTAKASPDFRDVVRFVWSTRLWIAIGLVAGLAAGCTSYLFSDRWYSAEVVLQPSQGPDDATSGLNAMISRLGSVAAIAGLQKGLGERYDEAVATLKSRGFFQDFDSAVGFRSKASEYIRGPVGRIVHEGPPSPEDAYRFFHQEVVSLLEDKGRTTLRLRVVWRDPDTASAWANRVVEMINERMRTSSLQAAERNLAYLEKELQSTSSLETRNAIALLLQRETERRMLANVTKDFGLHVLDAARPKAPEDFDSPQLVIRLVTGALLGSLLALLAHFLWVSRKTPA